MTAQKTTEYYCGFEGNKQQSYSLQAEKKTKSKF